jgi:hypothetical protein
MTPCLTAQMIINCRSSALRALQGYHASAAERVFQEAGIDLFGSVIGD